MGVCFKCRRRHKCFHPGVRRRFKASKRGTTTDAKDQASQKIRRKAKGSKASLHDSSSSVHSSSAASFSDLPPELLEKILTHALFQDNPDQYQLDNMLKWFFGFRTVNTIWRDVCDNMIRMADNEVKEQIEYNIAYNQRIPAGLNRDQYEKYLANNPWTFKLKKWFWTILLMKLETEANDKSNKSVFEYLFGGQEPHAPGSYKFCDPAKKKEVESLVHYKLTSS